MSAFHQPSLTTLITSCIVSTVLALVILLIAVLPAEFNIDPTGLGNKLGLTQLANTTNEEDRPIAIACDKNSTQDQQENLTHWQDQVIIVLPPHKGVEYKFNIEKDQVFDFEWQTLAKKPLYFDFHGEPKGDTSGYFRSYKETTDYQSSGTLNPPFSGSHGWYWENKSGRTITIHLKTKGNYTVKGLL